MNTADEFLKQKHLFQLGDLPTETPHPNTTRLSEWSQNDPLHALQVLREIDLQALHRVLSLKSELTPLFHAVADTLDQGNRIYLVGCGATGRLSLSLEFLWRQQHPGSEQVISLMAGGDVALVHSLEGFEDFPQYGARHLRQLGFDRSDLLIGSTEGGETPYVIGAVEEATRVSRRKPQFLYCNTKQILLDKVERSCRVLSNPAIESYCLDTGPMALTGSTRMQASTVLMLTIGLALEFKKDVEGAFECLKSWIHFLAESQVSSLKPFILKEAQTYQEGNYTIYMVDEVAITAFTDTTERAPTFNLAPFDNPNHLTERHSMTYISLPGTFDALSAWEKLLARPPRPLQWPEIHTKTSESYLLSFDFSNRALAFRQAILPDVQHFPFSIQLHEGKLFFRFRDVEGTFAVSQQLPLLDHLTLKMLLNMHSTLVMGRLGRFEGNLMTWVFPSNGKLIDRAARYTQILLERAGYRQFSYDDIVRAQFGCKADLSPKESIVHKTMERLVDKVAPGQSAPP